MKFFEMFKKGPEKKRSLAEEFAADDAEMTAKKEAKESQVAKGVAESFIDGVEDGSVDLKTVPEKDIPSWYDAVKKKHESWMRKAKMLEDRVPTMDAELDEGPETKRPKPYFGEKGKRSQDMIAAEAIHELSDTSERDAKESRGAERAAEAFVDDIEDDSFDLTTVPEKDIPSYHKVIMRKAGVWKEAMKTLESRVTEVAPEDIEDADQRKAA
jgi:hypothetical protein